MVCGTMAIAQGGGIDHRSRQTGDRNLTLQVNDPGPGRIVLAAAGCPASSCASQPGLCTLTQSLDLTSDAGNSVACANDDGTTAGGWARCFDMAAEGLQSGGFTVNSVTFGVQEATIDGIRIDVVLYADDDGCPPPGASGSPLDVVEIGRETVTVNIADVGTFITVPFPGGPVVANADALIVEVEQVDDGTAMPFFSFRPISNTGGQCAASYIRAADCGITGWIDLAVIGFADSHLILSIEGELGPPPCPATVCSDSGCKVTHSVDTTTIGGMVACASSVGTTDQGWARCYDFAAEGVPASPVGYVVEEVSFGVSEITVDGVVVDIVLYTDDNGCPAELDGPGINTTEIAREAVIVNIADDGTIITVRFTDPPAVPDDVHLIVEIEQIVNGSVEDPAGQFFFRPAGNDGGECADSFLRAERCGIPMWLSFGAIGFGDIHLLQSVRISSTPPFACFAVGELEIQKEADDDSDSDSDSDDDSDSDSNDETLKLEGSLDAGPDFNPELEDITYEFIDEADGDTHTFFIPAGSFQPRGQDTFRFESRSIKAKFELDECEFEFQVIDGRSFDDMDGPDITVRLITSASGFGEQTVTTKVSHDKLKFKAESKPECCPGQPHRADLDRGGSVNLIDLQLLISNWGVCPDCGNCPADIDGDCAAGIADLLILLANWD
ncbi:MAG: hypothetical protein IH888_10625 [Planctomycetes bacterium]|nr:hypothetical protein [Planctomycetota bacterium]